MTDGQPVPWLQTQLYSKNGPTSVGHDVRRRAWHYGQPAQLLAQRRTGSRRVIGAGAGAAVGLIGVLVTRGHPTYLYPEQTLTFRVQAAIPVSTGTSGASGVPLGRTRRL